MNTPEISFETIQGKNLIVRISAKNTTMLLRADRICGAEIAGTSTMRIFYMEGQPYVVKFDDPAKCASMLECVLDAMKEA